METLNKAPDQLDKSIVETIEKTGEQLGQVRGAIGQVIFGQQNVIDLSVATILTGARCSQIGFLPVLIFWQVVQVLFMALYTDVTAEVDGFVYILLFCQRRYILYRSTVCSA